MSERALLVRRVWKRIEQADEVWLSLPKPEEVHLVQGWAVYDVALWVSWSSYTQFPEYSAYVAAPSPFAAIERLMRLCGLQGVGHAAAFVPDGSLKYRCYRVWLAPLEHEHYYWFDA